MRQAWLVVFILGALSFARSPAYARFIAVMSYDELMKQADLVVIAEPTQTKDLNEKPNSSGLPVVGVQTTFHVKNIIKGSVEGNTFQLHHYRYDTERMEKDQSGKVTFLTNVPSLAAFGRDHEDRCAAGEYLMFLKSECGNTFAPLAGQEDVFVSIKRLTYPPPDRPFRAEPELDASACRFRLEIRSEHPYKVSKSLMDDIINIGGVTEAQGGQTDGDFSLVVRARGRDPEGDQQVLQQVLRKLKDAKDVRVVASDLIHRRQDVSPKASPQKSESSQSVNPANSQQPQSPAEPGQLR